MNLFAFVLCLFAVSAYGADNFQHVNVFIGTGGNGYGIGLFSCHFLIFVKRKYQSGSPISTVCENIRM